MKTDVEELSPTRVKLTVEVPFEELKPNLDQAYREVASQVRIPGFRPGHVPPRVIDQRVGRGAVLEQAVKEAVPRAVRQGGLEEHDVFALGQPDVEITKLDDGKELAFTAEVDVRPRFEVPDIDGMPVTVEDADVDPDQVEEYIGSLRERFASLRAPTGPSRQATSSPSTWPPWRTGSRSRTRRPAASPTRSAAAPMLDGLDEALVGMSAGETARRSPPSWPAASSAGTPGRRDREGRQRQGQGAARARRRLRPVRQRVRHARRAARRDQEAAGKHAPGRPGGPGQGAGPRRAAGQGRHPAARGPRGPRDRVAQAVPG